MNVKNGTASSVSFDMTPNMRSGSARSSDGVEQAELDADQAEHDADWPPSENATGKAEQQEDDQRREHQRRHVGDEPRGHGFSQYRRLDSALARDLLGKLLLGRLAVVLLERIADRARAGTRSA